MAQPPAAQRTFQARRVGADVRAPAGPASTVHHHGAAGRPHEAHQLAFRLASTASQARACGLIRHAVSGGVSARFSETGVADASGPGVVTG